MDRARWLRVESIVADAMEAPPDARAGIIAAACVGDEVLQNEVLSLLDQLDADPEFLERPLLGEGPVAPVAAGPWQLGRLLGRGGMGEVFHATRRADDVTQEAALKVIRRGADSEEVVHRFRLERRILAQLRHPNIARLLDAGMTDDGRPFFAMEYVDGAPLTAHADAAGLGLRARLALFLEVCAAVEHAHHHLVVHRDLKPRNILVTADGTPKLLDFGIGKVLDDTGAFGTSIETRAEARLLTPEYAAPEQLAGDGVTTATDVYALGLILHELLAGGHPYLTPGMTRNELEAAIRTREPLRPSEYRRQHTSGADAQARALEGDLDTIVLMALRKEPGRRYATVTALREDLQRHLDGLPVVARPDTLAYRLHKFVGRNRGIVVAAAAILVALVGVTASSLVTARRVAAAAARAEAERDKALEVRGFLMEMFGATGADQSVGDTVSVRALLDRQRAQLDVAFAGRDAVKADMLDVLADGYDRLGLYADAEPLARQALELRIALLAPGHPDIATSQNLLGWILHERGRSEDALVLLQRAEQARRADSVRSREPLARTLNDLGVVFNARKQYGDAQRVLTEALAIRRAINGDTHRAVGITANNLAAAWYFQQQLDSAIAVQALALQALQASVGRDHQRTTVALGNLAAFRRAKGDLAGAEREYRELLARQSRLQGRSHPVTARILTSLAIVLADRARGGGADSLLAESATLYEEALQAFVERLGPQHPQVADTRRRLDAVQAQMQAARQSRR